ncbi:hypothetical protein GH733_006696 [Mirounga leonina]|nr:hypothetical protein GH733_006696 [Mirounga leonina]
MARFWVCLAGAGFFLALLVLHSRFCGSPVLRKFAFQISWRTKEIPYRLDVGWPKYSEYFTGATFCVAIDSLSGLVYIAQRGDNIPKVLVFTEDGYFLRSWNYTVDTPHGIFAASTLHEQSVWITDVGSGSYGHTIKKYNSFGDLVQVLGTPGKKGTGLNPLQFDNPAELYVDDTGDIYIVDGDGGLNNRLIKLSQDFMMLWLHGERGTGPAKFNIPHSVWVADRGNKRIQVFDKDTGEFTPDGKYVIVAQLNLSRLLLVAAPPVGSIGNCSVIGTIQLADQVLPHLLDVSGKTGAIYVAEIGAKQVQKYVPMNSYFPSFDKDAMEETVDKFSRGTTRTPRKTLLFKPITDPIQRSNLNCMSGKQCGPGQLEARRAIRYSDSYSPFTPHEQLKLESLVRKIRTKSTASQKEVEPQEQTAKEEGVSSTIASLGVQTPGQINLDFGKEHMPCLRILDMESTGNAGTRPFFSPLPEMRWLPFLLPTFRSLSPSELCPVLSQKSWLTKIRGVIARRTSPKREKKAALLRAPRAHRSCWSAIPAPFALRSLNLRSPTAHALDYCADIPWSFEG